MSESWLAAGRLSCGLPRYDCVCVSLSQSFAPSTQGEAGGDKHAASNASPRVYLLKQHFSVDQCALNLLEMSMKAEPCSLRISRP